MKLEFWLSPERCAKNSQKSKFTKIRSVRAQ